MLRHQVKLFIFHNFHYATLSSYITKHFTDCNGVSTFPKLSIFSAICIERTPSYISSFSNFESDFNQYSDEKLTNLSRLSNYEVDKTHVQFLTLQVNQKIKYGKLSQKELLR